MKDDILVKIRRHIGHPKYRPLNKSEFARELNVSPNNRQKLRQALAILVERGELEMGKKSRFYKPRVSNTEKYEGVIQFTQRQGRRSAHFIPDYPEKIPALRKSGADRLFVSRRSAKNAINGDRVAVIVVEKGPPRWKNQSKSSKHRRSRKRPAHETPQVEGRVVDIIERGLTRFVGTYHKRGKSAAITPEDSRLPRSFDLKEVLPKAKAGELVVAQFVVWSDPERAPLAKMVEILGPGDKPGVDMLTAVSYTHLTLPTIYSV